MADKQASFWRELLGGVGSTLARMVVTTFVLAIVGAAVGGIAGWAYGGQIMGLIGAGVGAIAFAGGWIAFAVMLFD